MQGRKIKRKIFTAVGILAVMALLVWFLLYGENFDIIKSVFSGDVEKENVQDTLHELGFRGYLTIVFLSMLQVITMVLPAEPVQVLAGLSFGVGTALLCCIGGVMLGITLIYIAYKIYGERLSSYFDKKLDIDVKSYGNSSVLTLVIFILYFLPAIPYGMICFICATMKMKYPRYLIINTLGAIPSELIGILLGHMAMSTSWIFSIIVFAVLIVLLILFMSKKDYLTKKANEYIKFRADLKAGRITARPYKPWRLSLPYYVARLLLFGRVKCVLENKVGEIEKPSIVLVNHGAFIDFVYAGSLLRKISPHFVVARLYFYKHLLANVLTGVGAFPKSMFALDIESAKNCTRVLKNGGVLAMMPEARLSTVGRFEDIQPQTYDFLKKCGVSVYSIKLEGDYLAKPKWADKIRRGSVVYGTLDLLFSEEEIENLSVKEIKSRTEARLSYDEYEFLERHPEISYKHKTMAVGLENVLSLCPKCGRRYTMKTEKNRIYCDCGMTATIDSRYKFENAYPFEKISEWYDFGLSDLRERLSRDPDFSISSKVTLHHSSLDGKKMLRRAGEGVCTLSREGLIYVGTRDGEEITKLFPLDKIYRILFGSGENFELYEGREMWYFRPSELRMAVDFYNLSIVLKETTL